MLSGFIVKKGSMTRMFFAKWSPNCVTHCQALPLMVTQIKTKTNKDKYDAIQFSYGTRKHQKQPVASKLQKLKITTIPHGFVEFQSTTSEIPAVGSPIGVDQVFSVGDQVNASGISKGKGYAGVIKRHGFHRQPVSGGQSDRTRAPGAIVPRLPVKLLKVKECPDTWVTKILPSLI